MNWLYKINQDITGNLKKDTPQYRFFKVGVDSYVIQRQQQKSETPKAPPRQQKATKISFSPKKPDPPPDTSREVTPENTFTRDAITYIRQISNDDELADFAAENFNTRLDHIIGNEYRIKNKLGWFEMVYLANRRVNKIEKGDEKKFNKFLNDADEKFNIKEIEKKKPDTDIFKDIIMPAELPIKQPSTGSGYSNRAVTTPCSKSIFDDISRLEILIGGKRAGNNSPQLINEATEIAQRLFHGHVMDMSTYRKFVNELIDDYYSD